MRVLTLTPALFVSACKELGNRAVAAGAFDMIVSIRNGGTRVAEAMIGEVPPLQTLPHHAVTLRRPSSARKEKCGISKLASLPVPILNVLRMGESLWLRFLHKMSPKEARGFTLPDELVKALTESTSPDVLVVDDAVDSGVTLAAVVDGMQRVNPDAHLVTAVLTVTTPHPAITPDITLYPRGTLVRAPWAADYNPAKFEAHDL